MYEFFEYLDSLCISSEEIFIFGNIRLVKKFKSVSDFIFLRRDEIYSI